jgi:hypothetical protein
MSVLEIEVSVSSTGLVSGRRSDGAYGPQGQLGVRGVDAELIRVFERWLAERDREWRHADLRAFGSLLHRALFPADLWYWIEQSLDSLPQNDRMRLQLAFPTDGLGHLAAIPWEYLYAPDRAGREGFFLATDRRCALNRYIPMELGRRDVALDRSLRVLVLVSQPADLGEVIAQPVLDELANAGDTLPMELTVRHQPTRNMVDEIVTALRPDVVQFMGHGRYDEQAEQGQVALVDDAGRADWVGEAVLAQLLGDAGEMPRLVYLHSCSGAQADYEASFAGIAAPAHPARHSVRGGHAVRGDESDRNRFHQGLLPRADRRAAAGRGRSGRSAQPGRALRAEPSPARDPRCLPLQPQRVVGAQLEA